MVSTPSNSVSTHTLRLKADAASMKRGLDAVDAQLTKVTKALDRQQAAAAVVAKSQRSMAASTRQVASAQQELDAAVRQSKAATAAYAREMDVLSMKYKKGYAAQKQYEEAVRELKRANELGILSTREYADAVEQLGIEYKQFAAGQAKWDNQFVQGANRKGKSLNKFGMYTQQVGYQVSDFVVQVQGGTSAFVAFGQQGAQLFALIPGWGPILSIGAALVGAFGAAWLASSKDMEKAKDEADALDASLETLISTMREYEKEKTFKRLGLSTETGTIREAIQLAEAERKAVVAALDSLSSGQSFLSGTVGSIPFAGGLLKDAMGLSPEARQEALDVADAAIAELYDLLRKYEAREKEARIQHARETAIAAATEEFRIRSEGYEEYYENMNAQMRREQDAIEATRDETLKSAKDRFSKLLAMAKAYMAENAKIVAGEGQANINAALDFFDEHLAKQQAALKIMEENAEAAAKHQEELAAEAERARKATEALGKAMAEGVVNGIVRAKAEMTGFLGQLRSAMGLAWQTAVYKTTTGDNEFMALYNAGLVGGPTPVTLAAAHGVNVPYRPNAVSDDGGGGSSGGKSAAEKQAEDLTKLKEAFDKSIDAAKLFGETMEESFAQLATSSLDTFIDGLVSGEMKFKEFARSLLADLAKIMLRAAVVNALLSAVGVNKGMDPTQMTFVQKMVSGMAGLKFAKGGVFDGGNVVPFAKGGIVSGPTAFPLSGGTTGLMGEAGPEAVMPLSRNSSGDLGVAGPAITINNYTGEPVSVDRSEEMITIAVGRAVQATESSFVRSMSSGQGAYARAIEGNYSARRKAT